MGTEHFDVSSEVEENGEPLTIPANGDRASEPVSQLELSHALREKLFTEGLEDDDVRKLLNPETVDNRPVDDSYPLSCYYVSTSHNTYLLSRQLVGTASSSVYKHVIQNGCRCVEIDVWDSEAGPIVTHGLTLSSKTPFQDVVEAIGSSVKEDDWPLMVSLENHASDKVQEEMVKIMKDTWGSKLVDKSLEKFEKNVPPSQLKGRILLIVEWYPDVSEVETTAEHKNQHLEHTLEALHLEKKPEEVKLKIIPELAALGVYAQSVKPKKDFLLLADPEHPSNLFLNVSESAMPSIIPQLLQQFITRTVLRQCRIYPEGTRIESSNYNPVPYWRGGAQICAQNWQKFDKGMQLTRAMFEGTPGYVLKPASLLGQYKKGDEAPKSGGPVTFSCEIWGVSGVPLSVKPESKDPNLYVMAQLFHADGDRKWRSATVPALISKSSTDDEKPIVDVSFEPTQKFEWDYDASAELTFLRLMVVHQVKYEMDVKVGMYAVNLALHEPGLQALRLYNAKGEHTNAGLVVKTSLTPGV